MKQSGIYKIINTENGKVYIGQSVNVSQRKCAHFHWLSSGKHPNKHLQRAYNKNGKNCFSFGIILYCEPFELTRYEQGIIDYSNNIYNLRLECTNSNKGLKFTRESKEKMSKSQTGRKHSEETKRKISASNVGKTLSNEQKQKLINSHLGKPLSDDWKHKLSIALIGKRHSEESIKRVAQKHIGMKRSQETRHNMSVASKKRKAREAHERYMKEKENYENTLV